MIARVNHHLKPILADERRHESDDTVLVGVGKGFRVSPIADEPLSKQSLLRPRELRQQSFGFLKCGHGLSVSVKLESVVAHLQVEFPML